jgi:ectoine hydroxylase-related dioxygenase (phytanoyl-CoA dioxygenase family)
LDLHAEFHAAWSNPRLLAAVRHLMGAPFQPVSLNYRAPQTGFGHQGFHHDTPFLGRPPSRGYVQSIVALVDFTAEGGATRVVPGSHRFDHFPNDAMADVEGRHPGELALSGPAGTIFVLDGNTWHAGGLNSSAVPRHSLHSSWMARTVTSEFLLNQRQPVPRRILDEIGPDAAGVLNAVAIS